MLKLHTSMNLEEISLAVEAAVILGLQTESAVFPIAGTCGDMELPKKREELGRLWKLTAKETPEDYIPAKPEGELFQLDFRRRKGLETVFSLGSFMKDENQDFLPDRLDVKLCLPEDADISVVTAACNIAFRLGMETTSYEGTLLAEAGYDGNAIIFENCGEPKMTLEESGDQVKVHIWGCGEGLEKFSALLCEQFPKVDAWRTWREALMDMTDDLTMRNPDGQLAYLKAVADHAASGSEEAYEAFVSPEMTEEQKSYFKDTRFRNYKAGKAVYEKEYEIPWEADTFEELLEQKVYPKVKAGDKVRVLAALSEDQKVRADLAAKMNRAIVERAAVLEQADIVCAYKQGFSWIDECVIPVLKEKAADRVEILFRPFLPEGQTDWLDENGATPKRVRLVEDTPDKWFDLPIRYLQELYPIEDVIVRELGIAREQIQFKVYEGKEDITYLCRAYKEEESIYEDTYLAAYSERPQMDEYPQLGKVHPSTGYLKVWLNGEVIADERIQTDLEAVWDIYQSQVLPECKNYILQKTGGAVRADLQPFFQKLHLDITLSEPEYRIGSREDIFSPLNALHEDLYFTGSDYFKYLGQMNGVTIDAPGLILPDLHVGEGKPKFKVTLLEPLKEKACITRSGEVICEQKNRDEVSAWISEVGMEDGTLFVTVQTEGVNEAVLQVYTELYTEGVLGISKTLDGFGKLILAGEERHFTSCQAVKAAKTKRIEEIDLHEYEVIGYEQYREIIEQLKEVPGIEVFRTAVSYAGREAYAIWLKPEYKGYLSMTKYLTNHPSEYINARHHANEVSSTNAAFLLLKKLLTEDTYKGLADKMNLVIVPMENVDGAAIHYELQKEHPYWTFHVARFNSIGKEFCYEYYQDDALNTEAMTSTRIVEKFVPDIMVDNHGVPAHEWEQQFSGYTSPAYKGFWLPRSLLYGYFWYAKEEQYAENLKVSRKMEDVIADKIAEDEEMRSWNRNWSAQFEKYAHEWLPLLFPADYYKEMINYWVPYTTGPKNFYVAAKYPWITTVSYTSEVADETAQGEYLNLCARAHVAHDEATIQMLMKADCYQECGLICQNDFVSAKYFRQRPMRV